MRDAWEMFSNAEGGGDREGSQGSMKREEYVCVCFCV